MNKLHLTKTVSTKNLTKKGDANMWWIIMGAVVALVAVILIIIWFSGSGGKGYDVAKDKLLGLNDFDGDTVADAFDKCPCDAGDTNAKYDGCSFGTTEEQLKSVKKISECK